METKDMNIEQIEARKAEIVEEMKVDGADLDVLEAEMRSLNERKDAIRVEVEERAKVVEEVIATPVAEPVIIEERKTMTDKEVRSSQAYIDAFANYIKTGKDEECRALLTENATGGQIPVPTLVEDRVRTAWERDGIFSRVRKSYLKGNIKIGFEISADGAVIHTEGGDAPTQENLVLGVVELVPQSIKKWITISDETLDMKSNAFLEYVYDELTYQIAKKAVDTLIAKIVSCGSVSTNTPTTNVAVPVIEANSATMSLIAEAIANLSDEATDPIVVMNKLSSAEFKQAQVAGNFSADPYEGLPVAFNNTLKPFATATTGETIAIVGDFGNGALMNFPNGNDITIKYDDMSLAEADLVKLVGREFVGMGVVAPKQFVKIVKPAAVE